VPHSFALFANSSASRSRRFPSSAEARRLAIFRRFVTRFRCFICRSMYIYQYQYNIVSTNVPRGTFRRSLHFSRWKR